MALTNRLEKLSFRFVVTKFPKNVSRYSEGRRNSAVGALAGVDNMLERLAALLSAVRAMHRIEPF